MELFFRANDLPAMCSTAVLFRDQDAALFSLPPSVDGYALLMDFVVTFVALAAFLRFRLQLVLGGNHADRSLIEELEPNLPLLQPNKAETGAKKNKPKLEPPL
jgi:hypothetical protein